MLLYVTYYLSLSTGTSLLCFHYRYDKEKNELISDSIKVAYPIINGIPNLVPQDGRILGEPEKTEA